MSIKESMLLLMMGSILMSCSLSQSSFNKEHDSVAKKAEVKVKLDTLKRGLRPYYEIINSKAITDDGLFKVHKVDDKYFFEIPDSLLDADILVVNRISKAPSKNGFGGDWIGENLIQFSKESNNKLSIKRMSYITRSSDSSETGMYQAVQNSNFQPIAAIFEIKALSADLKGVVIDVTDYVNSDNDVLFFSNISKGVLGYSLGPYQADKSFIKSIKSFPLNIEIKTIKTYSKTPDILSYELNSSIVLLPKNPMKYREQEKRVGYFSKGYYSYDPSLPVQINRMVTRWRIEPKIEDINKYINGELVEPQKPIIYYIDPATPKKWVPYLIQGVNDWQKAFEKAGFKNAIYALEAPGDDSTWSLEDARHNAIVYKAAAIQNASGPLVSDPRTGEILETHINWYHNIQELMHDWYMIQAGPNDPNARKMNFDDSLMGQLIRYVCTHEVGHTLGLKHNFLASSTVPVDSLRSKQYVDSNGFCPSIMDYARFNYIAQPEDKFLPKNLIPRIGAYDEWAIEWGYRWFPDDSRTESSFLSKWVTDRLERNKKIWFAETAISLLDRNWDHKCQVEDLGDDATKAGRLGIKNLKRVMSSIKEWTREPSKDYESLARINDQVVQQFKRYLFHVSSIIGGHSWLNKSVEQDGEGAVYASREQQKAAVKFFNDELFSTPVWLLDNEIYRLSAGEHIHYLATGNSYRLLSLQGAILLKITSHNSYSNLLSQQSALGTKAYTIDELLTEIEKGIWSELTTKDSINIYRRSLQKLYVERLIRQLNTKSDEGRLTSLDGMLFSFENTFTDALAVIKQHLRSLQAKTHAALRVFKDKESRLHLLEISDRIKNGLNNNFENYPSAKKMQKDNIDAYKSQSFNIDDSFLLERESSQFNLGCWSNDPM